MGSFVPRFATAGNKGSERDLQTSAWCESRARAHQATRRLFVALGALAIGGWLGACRCDTATEQLGGRSAARSGVGEGAGGSGEAASPPPRAAWPAIARSRAALDAAIDAFVAAGSRTTDTAHSSTAGRPADAAPSSADRPPEAAAAPRQAAGSGTQSEPGAEQLMRTLRTAATGGQVRGGWPSVVAALRHRLDAASAAHRSIVLLWAVTHDTGAPIVALRRLVGPLGLDATVALELFAADGHWSDLSEMEQRGDGIALDRYRMDGSDAALEALRAAQQEDDYAAWKYGYLDDVLDLLVAARVAARPLLGCDLPSAVEYQLRSELGDDTERLRELHCALTLRPLLTSQSAPARIVALWGNAHAQPDRLPRLLGADAEVVVVRVLGGRPVDAGLEATAGKHLALGEPLLVPETGSLSTTGGYWLLLPDRRWGLSVERVRTAHGCPLPANQQRRVRVSSDAPGTMWFSGSKKLEVGLEPRSIVLSPGWHSYWLDTGELAMAGAVEMPRAGQLELDLETTNRFVLATTVRCAGP